MSSITDFVGQLTSGFARTNRYSVELALPPAVRDSTHISDVQRMLLLCESVQLPALNVNTTQIRTFGEIREMPYEFNYDAISMSFYVDGDMIVKNIFDKWIKSIQQGTTRNFNYYDNYVAPTMRINVEDLEDNVVQTITLYEAYPKTVNAVQLSYEQKDIMKLTVSMMYRWWESSAGYVEPVAPVPQTNPTNILPEPLADTTTITNYNLGNPMGDLSNFGSGW